MRALKLYGFLLAGAAFSFPALAGVGTTSSGVIPTVGNGNSTDPSANVQQQSSAFVQQNQQNQQAQTGAARPGASATTSTTIATTAGTSASGAGNTAAGGNANPAAAGAPGAAPPPVPATPPPPPPTYVSNIKKVTPTENAPEGSKAPSVVMSGAGVPKAEPPPEAHPAENVEATASASPHPVQLPAEAPKPPQRSAPIPASNAVANTAKTLAVAKPAPEPPGGGVGAAPDGITFYAGVGSAGVLLAFAFATYLRSQKDENAGR